MTTNLLILIMSIIQVESSGNDRAVGDKGAAAGCMQIHACVIQDVNEYAGTKYTLADRFSRRKSAEIFRLYIARWCTRERLKRSVTWQDMARCWQGGGPRGWKNPATVKYWHKVRRELEKQVIVSTKRKESKCRKKNH